MANLLEQLLASENGTSDFERGITPVRMAKKTATSSAASRSAVRFNTQTPLKKDFETHKFAKDLVFFGSLMGMPNSSRHLNHYLEGGEIGEIGRDKNGRLLPEPVPLSVNVAAMLTEIPGFREQVLDQMEVLRRDIRKRWTAGERPRKVNGKSTLAGTTALTSRDWFYALGRFTFTVKCTLDGVRERQKGKVYANVHYTLEVEDFYDWDQDSVVLPVPHPETGEEIVIPDGVMRRLHDVGLAREYPIKSTHSMRTEKLESS